MRKKLSILLILALSVVVIGTLANSFRNVSDSNSKDEGDVLQSFTYTSERYGFSLDFPATWLDLEVYEDTYYPVNGQEARRVVFGLPDQEIIFFISIHDPEQWEEIKHLVSVPYELEVYEDAVYAFAVVPSGTNEFIERRIAETPMILDTFTLK